MRVTPERNFPPGVAAAVFLFIVMLGLLGIYFDIANPLQLPE